MKPALVPGPRAGFTVLEVLIAMAILLLGATSILSMLTAGSAIARTGQLRTAAAARVEAVCADLEEQLFPLAADGSVGEPRTIEGRAVPGSPGLVYSAHATENPRLEGEYRVDVEFSWQSSGVRRTHRFTTLLLREAPFGVRMRALRRNPGTTPSEKR